MKVQIRSRQLGAAALAIFFAVVFLPNIAGAAPKADGGSGPSVQGLENASAHANDNAADNSNAAVHDDAEELADAIADAVAEVTATPGNQVCDGTNGSAAGNGTVDDEGTYADSCDFGPSPNGNGDGEAVGKPCAGCVGNADDMNPAGHEPGPKNDQNAGYECDPQGGEDGGNAGVGVGNPAHTGCEQPPVTPISTCVPSAANNFCGNPPPPPPPPEPEPELPEPEENEPVGNQPEIEGAELVSKKPPQVLGVQFNNGVAPAAFARTGSEPAPLVVAGLMMLFTGGLLVAVMRRQRAWVSLE